MCDRLMLHEVPHSYCIIQYICFALFVFITQAMWPRVQGWWSADCVCLGPECKTYHYASWWVSQFYQFTFFTAWCSISRHNNIYIADVGYHIGGDSNINYLVVQIHYRHPAKGLDTWKKDKSQPNETFKGRAKASPNENFTSQKWPILCHAIYRFK